MLNVSRIFSIRTSILFLRSWLIFTIILLNSFQVGCQSPLHLVLVGFYLVPLSGTCFSAISFFSNFLFSWSPSAGCRTVALLVSGVCPLVGEVGPGLVQASWCEGLVPALWWVELG